MNPRQPARKVIPFYPDKNTNPTFYAGEEHQLARIAGELNEMNKVLPCLLDTIENNSNLISYLTDLLEKEREERNGRT